MGGHPGKFESLTSHSQQCWKMTVKMTPQSDVQEVDIEEDQGEDM
jgi:hypothetical protein